MLKSGILNPHLNSLLSRVRHTNLLVIADRGFPAFPHIECIDITLVDDIPTVLDVFQAILPNFSIGAIWMASEFLQEGSGLHNRTKMQEALQNQQLIFEPHEELKRRAQSAIGIIRTADTIPYANAIIESA